MTYKDHINQLADRVWQDFQENMNLDYPRPRIVFSEKEAFEIIEDAQRSIGFDPQKNVRHRDYALEDSESQCIMWKGAFEHHGKIWGVSGPLQMGKVDAAYQEFVLQHEFTHYALGRDSVYVRTAAAFVYPHFSLKPSLWQKLRRQDNSKEESFYYGNGEFKYDFEEVLCWAVSAALSGDQTLNGYKLVTERDIQMHNVISEKDKVASIEINNRLFRYGSMLNKLLEGDISRVLNPREVIELNQISWDYAFHSGKFQKIYEDVIKSREKAKIIPIEHID